MSYPLGYVQGRLLEMPKRGYQAFPLENWHEEFALAKQRSLSHVEWVVDTYTLHNNPLVTSSEEVLALTQQNDIAISVICLDFLMFTKEITITQALASSMRYLSAGAKVGANYVLLPLVDGSSTLKKSMDMSVAFDLTRQIADEANSLGLQVLLELDLPPQGVTRFLEALGAEALINYDIGNSASLGYQWEEEVSEYGSRIGSLHIKDRYLGGGPAMLGEGNSDWIGVLGWWLGNNVTSGPTTMQTFRDENGVEVFDKQLQMVREQISLDSRYLDGEA